jgi:hypothetical protein
LSRFPSLPVSDSEVRRWLSRHVPDTLQTRADGRRSLIDQAQKRLIETQDAEIADSTKHEAEMAALQKVFSRFLSDCDKAGLTPTADIGQLRRERWRQWKRVPQEYRQNPPLKSFRETPGYIFELNIGKYKDELCLALDGTLYKHQLNAVDPYPAEELLKSATAEKVADSLIASLVWLLQARQHPAEQNTHETAAAGPENGDSHEAAATPQNVKLTAAAPLED